MADYVLDELKEMRKSFDLSMKEMRTEVKQEMNTMRTELKQDISSVSSKVQEIKLQMTEYATKECVEDIKKNSEADISKLRSDNSASHKWLTGFISSVYAAIFALAYAILKK